MPQQQFIALSELTILLLIYFRIAEGECTKKNVEYEHQQVTGRRASVSFTYSVQWKEMKQFHPNRWDAFLLKPNPERHYYSLLNGTIVVLLVSGILAIIFFKTMVYSVKENTASDDKVP